MWFDRRAWRLRTRSQVVGLVGMSLCLSSCAYVRYTLQRPSTHLKLQAEDGTWVACDLYDKGRRRVIVVSPGFLQQKRSPGIWELSQVLQPDFDVIALDYRGTGESSGWYAYTAREAYDLHTVLQFANRRWAQVGVVGVSLGAAVAINELARHPEEARGLATISAPMAFDAIEKQVSPTLTTIALSEASWGMRSGNPFLPKTDPLTEISHLTVPILLIHGGADTVVYPRHSRQLYDHTQGPRALLIIPRAGHAHELILEYLPDCAAALTQWFDQTLR